MKSYQVEVERSTPVTPTVKIIRLRFKDALDFNFVAGQLISVRVERDGTEIIKPYSLAAPPWEKDYIELLIKRVEGGYVSNYMHNLKPGDELEIRGPAGLFMLDKPLNDNIIFLAVGSGLSALRSMLFVVLREKTSSSVSFIYGARTEDELVERSRWEEWEANNDNFLYIPTLSRPGDTWSGETGYVQNVLLKHFSDATHSDIYICGLWKMVEDAVEMAKEIGFPLKKIHYERFV